VGDRLEDGNSSVPLFLFYALLLLMLIGEDERGGIEEEVEGNRDRRGEERGNNNKEGEEGEWCRLRALRTQTQRATTPTTRRGACPAS
jgi:hypothetical protein